MPDYDALATQLGGKPKEEIDYDAIAQQMGGVASPPLSIPERARGFGPEIVSQAKQFGQGVAQMAGDVANLSPLSTNLPARAESAIRLGEGLKETVMRPVRELGGIRQPDESPETFKPFSPAERVPAAIGTALGADPARVRQLEREGDPSGAWAARLTAPLLNVGTSKLASAALGKSLPTPRARAAKLTYASGGEPGVVEAYSRVLPHLDETVKTPVTRPANLSPNAPWTSGKPPTTAHEQLGLVNATLGRLENEFNTALKPIANVKVSAKQIADAIRAKITDEMRQFEGGSAAEALANEATVYEQSPAYTLKALNERRMKLFRRKQAPMQERIAQRNDIQRIADDTAETVLRDIIYDAVDKGPQTPVYGQTPTAAPRNPTTAVSYPQVGVSRPLGRPSPGTIDLQQLDTVGQAHPPGYFRALKATEADLLTLKDALEKRGPQLTANEAMIEGAPFADKLREKATFYIHASGVPATAVRPFAVNKTATPAKAAKSVRSAFRPRANFPPAPAVMGLGVSQANPNRGQTAPPAP